MIGTAVTPDLDGLVNFDGVTGWDVAIALFVVIASVLLAKLVRRVVLRWLPEVDGVPEQVSLTLSRMAGYSVIVIGVVYAASWVGVDTGPIFLLILLIGVVAFFSMKPLLENFAAGLILQTRSPFDIGDEITLDDITGTLIEIDSRTVQIVTPDGIQVRLLNTAVVGGTLVNKTREGARRTTVTVGVAYGTDLGRARSVLRSAVTSVADVLPTPEPEIHLVAFGASSIEFELRYWHESSIADELAATDRVIESVDLALKAASIVIAFPQRDVWLRSDGPGRQEGIDKP
jgi:small conductance mechanosensitive channel